MPGVMVIGSEAPNLLEPNAASTLVISQDVDIGVPVACLEDVKTALRGVSDLEPSQEEPSVWLPRRPELIEVNFVGMGVDPDTITDAYIVEDEQLPLLVFGALSLLRLAPLLRIDDLEIPLPRPAGLLLEKLLTERTAEKGSRDLLVAVGLIEVIGETVLEELDELEAEKS